MEIGRYLVSNSSPTAYYIPNFVTETEEKFLLDEVYKAPKPKWTVLSERRLQNWGGLPHPKGMVQEALPKWLKDCCSSVYKLQVFSNSQPNHVLVNEYLPGQGIMPHQDGPLYHPVVTTRSLGSHTVIDFYSLTSESANGTSLSRKEKFSFLLEPRSLLVLKDSLYESHMHGIAMSLEDNLNEKTIANFELVGDAELKRKISEQQTVLLKRNTRVSLTIRNVPKTLRVKLQLTKSYK